MRHLEKRKRKGACIRLATVADELNGYLADADVLCDGGSTNAMKKFKKSKKK